MSLYPDVHCSSQASFSILFIYDCMLPCPSYMLHGEFYMHLLYWTNVTKFSNADTKNAMIYRPTSVALSCPEMSKCPENLALTHRVNWRHKSMATVRSPFCGHKKVKVAHTRLPSVGFRSWSRFSAVSLQVTWIINPTVGCHYFPSGLQLPPQPLRGLLPISLLGEQRHNGCEQFAQRTAIWTRALLRLSPAR